MEMHSFISSFDRPFSWSYEALGAADHWWRRIWFCFILPLSPVIVWGIFFIRSFVFYGISPLSSAHDAFVSVLTIRGLFLWVVLQIIPVVAILLIQLQKKLAIIGTEVLVVMVSASVILAAELIVRAPSIQSILCIASNRRPLPFADDCPLRARALRRLGDIAHTKDVWQNKSPCKVAIFGSSQLREGVDVTLLAQITGCSVQQQSVAGMLPEHMLIAREKLVSPETSLVVMQLSPFDLMAPYTQYADWGRMLSSRSGLWDLVNIMNIDQIEANWRELVELHIAASFSLWSSRDLARKIFFNLTSTRKWFTRTGKLEIEKSESNEAIESPVWADAETSKMRLRAVARLWKNLVSDGTNIILLQGSVNPVFMHKFPGQAWREWSSEIEALARVNGVEYVSTSDISLPYEEQFWSDNTHLNDKGKLKYTMALGGYIIERLR